MIVKQLFDIKSSTCTYTIASTKGRKAKIVDRVIKNSLIYINTDLLTRY